MRLETVSAIGAIVREVKGIGWFEKSFGKKDNVNLVLLKKRLELKLLGFDVLGVEEGYSE